MAATVSTVAAGDAPGRARYVQRFADRGLEVADTKNRQDRLSEHTDRTDLEQPLCNVVVQRPGRWEPFLWAAAVLQDHAERVNAAWMVIDGEAGTPITEWERQSFVARLGPSRRHDASVYVRRGAVAIIGFGGGRDILSAIWGRNSPITGVDVNQTMIQMLTGSHRRFAGVADRPEVRLVHDDGRRS